MTPVLVASAPRLLLPPPLPMLSLLLLLWQRICRAPCVHVCGQLRACCGRPAAVEELLLLMPLPAASVCAPGFWGCLANGRVGLGVKRSGAARPLTQT